MSPLVQMVVWSAGAYAGLVVAIRWMERVENSRADDLLPTDDELFTAAEVEQLRALAAEDGRQARAVTR